MLLVNANVGFYLILHCLQVKDLFAKRVDEDVTWHRYDDQLQRGGTTGGPGIDRTVHTVFFVLLL